MSSITPVRAALSFLVAVEILILFNVINLTLVYTSFGLLITVLAVWLALEITHRRYPLHPGIWILCALIIYLDAAGDILHFYATIPHYDKYVHFTNSGIAACAILTFALWRKRAPRVWDHWIAWSSVMALGGLYELEEFWESVFFHDNRWGGGPDTMTDMTANASGALLGVVLAALIIRYKNSIKREG